MFKTIPPIRDAQNFARWYAMRFICICMMALVFTGASYAFEFFDPLNDLRSYAGAIAVGLYLAAALLYRGDWHALPGYFDSLHQWIAQVQIDSLWRRSLRLPMHYGVVYVLQDVDVTLWCKIGKSTKPKTRIGEFDTMLPFETRIVHMIESKDCARLEAVLHAHFADQRMRGEWFDLSDEDIAWLRAWEVA